jgi:hypothetical protein
MNLKIESETENNEFMEENYQQMENSDSTSIKLNTTFN